MTTPQPQNGERFVCPKCAGVAGIHYLTCPTLRLPPRVPLYDPPVRRPGGQHPATVTR